MARLSAPTAPCKLCKTPSVLQRSHIIPHWVYRRLVAGGPPNSIRITDGIAITSGEQDAEHMLCRACEERISPSERYVASITRQEGGTFLALDQTTIVSTLSEQNLKVGDASALDCDLIAYFALSVIWRASVSSCFPKVNLGPKYNKIFADYLLGHSSFPSSAVLLIELMQFGILPRVDRILITPTSQRDGTFHIHEFYISGIRFFLMVGNVLPDGSKSASFTESKHVFFSDGLDLLKKVSLKLRLSTPKGSLARNKTH